MCIIGRSTCPHFHIALVGQHDANATIVGRINDDFSILDREGTALDGVGQLTSSFVIWTSRDNAAVISLLQFACSRCFEKSPPPPGRSGALMAHCCGGEPS